MKMSIEEHIKQLKKLKSFHNGSYGESINYALDIISKYQKIEQIIGNYGFDTSWLCLKKIREVMEDDNT